MGTVTVKTPVVASCQSLVVQVQARRGDMLYINDGVYGTLSDACALAFRYPCRLVKAAGGTMAA